MPKDSFCLHPCLHWLFHEHMLITHGTRFHYRTGGYVYSVFWPSPFSVTSSVLLHSCWCVHLPRQLYFYSPSLSLPTSLLLPCPPSVCPSEFSCLQEHRWEVTYRTTGSLAVANTPPKKGSISLFSSYWDSGKRVLYEPLPSSMSNLGRCSVWSYSCCGFGLVVLTP